MLNSHHSKLESQMWDKRLQLAQSCRKEKSEKVRREAREAYTLSFRSGIFLQFCNIIIIPGDSQLPSEFNQFYKFCYESEFRVQQTEGQDLQIPFDKCIDLIAQSKGTTHDLSTELCFKALKLISLFVSLRKELRLSTFLISTMLDLVTNSSEDLAIFGMQVLEMMVYHLAYGKEFVLSALTSFQLGHLNSQRGSEKYKISYFRFLVFLFHKNRGCPRVDQYNKILEIIDKQVSHFCHKPDILDIILRLPYLILECILRHKEGTNYKVERMLVLLLELLKNKKMFEPLSSQTQHYILEQIEYIVDKFGFCTFNLITAEYVEEVMKSTYSMTEENRKEAWKILSRMAKYDYFEIIFENSKANNLAFFELKQNRSLESSILFLTRLMHSLPEDSMCDTRLTRSRVMNIMIKSLKWLEEEDIELLEMQLPQLVSQQSFRSIFRQSQGVEEISRLMDQWESKEGLQRFAKSILNIVDDESSQVSYWELQE